MLHNGHRGYLVAHSRRPSLACSVWRCRWPTSDAGDFD